MKEEEVELLITIEYEGFITRLDLDEILRSIDGIIETELYGLFPENIVLLPQYYPFKVRRPSQNEPDITYLGIRSIDSGSLIISAFIGGAVLTYIGTRFAKGVDESLFAEELKRSGQISGDLLGNILSRINDWTEKYVDKQKERKGRISKIIAEKNSNHRDEET